MWPPHRIWEYQLQWIPDVRRVKQPFISDKLRSCLWNSIRENILKTTRKVSYVIKIICYTLNYSLSRCVCFKICLWVRLWCHLVFGYLILFLSLGLPIALVSVFVHSLLHSGNRICAGNIILYYYYGTCFLESGLRHCNTLESHLAYTGR